MLTKAPKGTKDIRPIDIGKWQYVENMFSKLCNIYGFKEIRTPVFEHTELFQRGVGDTTDIVQKEMYTFEDLGKRSITLKPEGTSPVARSFVEHKDYAKVQPTKFFYITPCYRYERPQSGRLREFHQFGVETYGATSALADAEVITLANDFLKAAGLTDYQLRINSVGCPICRKKHRTALKKFLENKYDVLCDTCKTRYDKNPMRILDCKSKVCSEAVEDAPLMLDYLCDDCMDSFEELKKYLKASQVEFKVDPKIVRGLDYYTKTAFEFVTEKIGAQGTICGGGRYDHLIEEVGGPETPGVGFGLGIERLLMLMESEGVKFPEDEPVEIFIATLGEESKLLGLKLLHEFRNQGIKCAIDVLERNFKGQFKYADRLNAKFVLVIGEEEIESGEVTIKDMSNSSQKKMKIEDLKLDFLNNLN